MYPGPSYGGSRRGLSVWEAWIIFYRLLPGPPVSWAWEKAVKRATIFANGGVNTAAIFASGGMQGSLKKMVQGLRNLEAGPASPLNWDPDTS